MTERYVVRYRDKDEVYSVFDTFACKTVLGSYTYIREIADRKAERLNPDPDPDWKDAHHEATDRTERPPVPSLPDAAEHLQPRPDVRPV